MNTARPLAIQAAQRLVLWCLLVALPIYGFAGTHVHLLGHAHFHKPVAAAAADVMADWAYFGSIVRGPIPHSTAAATIEPRNQTPAHSHDGLERHHHEEGDDSVVVVDGTGTADGATSGGNSAASLLTAQMFILPMSVMPAAPARVSNVWRAQAGPGFQSHHPDLPDKPPKA